MKPKTEQTPRDNPEQSKRFIEAARKAEADESEEGADRAFKKALQKREKPR
jgi:hypothetical protein